MQLAEVKTLCPEEDEEHSSVVLRHRDRLGRPVDQESEEEEYFKEELEMMESRKHRHAGFEANYEKRRANKTDGRYLRGIVHFLLMCVKTCYKTAGLSFVLIYYFLSICFCLTFSREKRENPVGARDGRRSRTLTKNEDDEFATGLIIG